MPRGRPPKPETAPAPDPSSGEIPADIAAADAADPDPDLADERADGGETRTSIHRPIASMGPFEDPFKRLAREMGTKDEEPQEAEVPQPGSVQAVTEEALARKGTTEYPDDMLVTVKLWEVNAAGVAGDPIMVAHNVLYSIARDPLTWIEYGGKWYVELIQPDTKKKLVRKTFVTRGDPAPKNWRPRIGGDEMTFEQFMQMFAKANSGDHGTIGVPTGVHANVEAGLRTDLGEVKGELREVRSKMETANADLAEARRQRDMATSKYDALKERFDDLKSELATVRNELTALRSNPPKGDGKPDWAYAAEVFGRKNDDGIKVNDLLKLQEKFTDAIAVLKDGGGNAAAISQLNTAMDLMEKMRKAAGLPTAGSTAAGEGDTLNKILGLADKAASLVQGRQRLVEIERGGRPPAQQGPSGQQPAQRTEQDVTKEALETTLKRLEVAFHSKVNPARVGQMLASSITWAAAMDFASADQDVKTFMGKIVKDPDKWIVWYAENLDPKIEGATEYGKQVAEAFKAAMNRGQPAPPPPSPEKPSGGNGKPKEPEVLTQQPVISPQPAAQPGNAGGDGGVSSLPPQVAPDASQVASTEPPGEAVTATVEPPKAN